MPMFYTPKPRQFHYKPWFYDPEKEEWEQLKMKYKIQSANSQQPTANSQQEDKDLEYFQRKVSEIDREERQQRQKLTLQDLFRCREKPTFHYVSRFDADGNLLETPPKDNVQKPKPKIQRRFDNAEDWDRFKPIPASKIIVSILLVFLLLIFIFF